MSYLSSEERCYIEVALREGISVSQIALNLGRHRSSIYREIKRNTMKIGTKGNFAAMPYQASSAQNITKMRKKQAGTKTKANKLLVDKILYYLSLKFSPEQIAYGVPNITVCTATIYNWIYNGIVPFAKKHLRRRGKRFKGKNTGKLLKRPDSQWFMNHSIEKRPIKVNKRQVFGHWEADSVLSTIRSKPTLATFVERKTRQYVTYKMPDRSAKSMHIAMRQLTDDYPGAVKSITCDRGTEFLNRIYTSIIEKLGVKIYLAHPYSPHERDSNENHNGLLREYFPKGTTFTKISQEDLDLATQAINKRPRKIHCWKSVEHVFKKELKKLRTV
ncbi:IS30 family transposase [Enterococcus faecalis]|nr:IS30 family transposase [Enterococcus faecalis]